MVHAFTCTGMTETQYHSFGEAAGIGSVMDKTIDTSKSLYILFATAGGLTVNKYNEVNQESMHVLFLFQQ